MDLSTTSRGGGQNKGDCYFMLYRTQNRLKKLYGGIKALQITFTQTNTTLYSHLMDYKRYDWTSPR